MRQRRCLPRKSLRCNNPGGLYPRPQMFGTFPCNLHAKHPCAASLSHVQAPGQSCQHSILHLGITSLLVGRECIDMVYIHRNTVQPRHNKRQTGLNICCCISPWSTMLVFTNLIVHGISIIVEIPKYMQIVYNLMNGGRVASN